MKRADSLTPDLFYVALYSLVERKYFEIFLTCEMNIKLY